MQINKDIVIIVTKYPQVGNVKSRLSNDIGKNKATEIYKSMLNDLIIEHSNKNYDLFVSFGVSEKKYINKINKILPNKNYIFTGNGLRNKQSTIWLSFKNFFTKYSKIIIIYGDVPNLSNDIITKSFNLLDKTDIVIGPDLGDAYYLIGMTEPIDLFTTLSNERIPYLKQTIELIKRKKKKYIFVDKLIDIDYLEDIKKN